MAPQPTIRNAQSKKMVDVIEEITPVVKPVIAMFLPPATPRLIRDSDKRLIMIAGIPRMGPRHVTIEETPRTIAAIE